MRSRAVRSLLALLFLSIPLLAISCTGSSKSSTKFVFKNESVTNQTYDVLIDGSRIGSISPGGDLTRTVNPGQYQVRFNFANGSTACSTSNPQIASGEIITLTCRG